jgi:hypothetical protein
MKKISLLALCLLVLAASGARAALTDLAGTYEYEFLSLPVHHVTAGGMRGVIEHPGVSWPVAGSELPVLRGEDIIGILRVDFVGGLHLWGSFLSHNDALRLKPGDMVIVPAAAPQRPQHNYPVSLAPARVVYHFPIGHGYWAFINRGAVDGLAGADSGAVSQHKEPVGDFKIVYAGEYYSYGVFAPYKRGQYHDSQTLEISFPAK